jgi:hypothetical protein
LVFSIISKSSWAFESHPVLKFVHSGNKYNYQTQNTHITKLQNTLWWQVANRNQVDPYILYAVALVESAKGRGENHISPWPWALNKAGKAIITASHEQARLILNKTLANGNRNIDVGLMQINVRWQGHRVKQPEQLLNPITNLKIGAVVLAEAIQSVPNNLVLGIGRYHSWQNMYAASAYGRKVLAIADQIRVVL